MTCTPLTISYHPYFILSMSKASNMLHHGSMRRVPSKDKNDALYWYTYTFLVFFCFASNICIFIFFISFFDGVSSFRNRILTTHQKLEIYRRQEIVSVTGWMGYFRKRTYREGSRTWNFQGYWKNKMWKSQGLRKGIYSGEQEKIICNFRKSWT